MQDERQDRKERHRVAERELPHLEASRTAGACSHYLDILADPGL